MNPSAPILVAITGASGPILAYHLLKMLKSLEVEVHLCISQGAKQTIALESEVPYPKYLDLADVCHHPKDLAAPISSGSFLTRAMLIVPTSMRTIAAIAQGYNDNLIQRAADVHLKEKRPLLLAPREAPLRTQHLKNLTALAQEGAIIIPPLIATYSKPSSLQDLYLHLCGRMLDQIGLHHPQASRWQGK